MKEENGKWVLGIKLEMQEKEREREKENVIKIFLREYLSWMLNEDAVQDSLKEYCMETLYKDNEGKNNKWNVNWRILSKEEKEI